MRVGRVHDPRDEAGDPEALEQLIEERVGRADREAGRARFEGAADEHPVVLEPADLDGPEPRVLAQRLPQRGGRRLGHVAPVDLDPAAQLPWAALDAAVERGAGRARAHHEPLLRPRQEVFVVFAAALLAARRVEGAVELDVDDRRVLARPCERLVERDAGRPSARPRPPRSSQWTLKRAASSSASMSQSSLTKATRRSRSLLIAAIVAAGSSRRSERAGLRPRTAGCPSCRSDGRRRG